jgi:acetolactate synthase I/II/III large subunit
MFQGKVVDLCLRHLKAEDVSYIFGIAGGLIHPLFAALAADSHFKIIHVRHEEGAGFMADGYARVSGKLAVCVVTSGPGATHTLTAVAAAMADGIPMLVISGNAATHALSRGSAQEMAREEMDIVEMFRPVTKYSAMVSAASTFGHHFRHALRVAFSGRPGPVHLNVPVDIWETVVQSADWFDAKAYRQQAFTLDSVAAKKAADALFEAEYPVLLVGSGAAKARTLLLQLANFIPLRIATTPRAKGIFPETHPASVGVFGSAGHEYAKRVCLGNKDVLFVVASSLGDTATLSWDKALQPSKSLIHLDIDQFHIGRNYPVDISIVGDASVTLAEIVSCVWKRSLTDNPASKWADTGERRAFDNVALRTSDQSPVTPQRWRADLQEVLPNNAIIFSDIGGHMLFNIHHLTIAEEQRFLLNLNFGTMGHGVVAPMGAKLASPGNPVISIIGDAGFHMIGLELLTAVEYDIPVIWIVENNRMHGMTWHCTKILSQGATLECAKPVKSVSIAGIATAMGIRSYIVGKPGEMQEVFKECLTLREPSLIEVLVDDNIPPPLGERAKVLTGFIDRK